MEIHSSPTQYAPLQNIEQNYISPGMRVATRLKAREANNNAMVAPAAGSESILAESSKPPVWTCTTRSRKIQEAHFNGKPHVRMEQRVRASADGSIVEEHGVQLLQTINSQLFDRQSSEKSSSPVPEPAPDAQPRANEKHLKGTRKFQVKTNSKKLGGASIHKKDGRSSTTTTRQTGMVYPSNTCFVGYGSGGFSSNFRTNASCGDEPLAYGLCDKEFGWCGHCMEGADL